MSPLRALLCAVIALALGAKVAHAQGEDAIPVAGGTLRIGIAPDWAHWNSRFGSGTPGFPSGSKEPLAVDFSSDSLGVAQMPFLTDAQNRLRAIGLTGFSFNLGRAQLTLNDSYRVIPISIEYAVSRRLGFRLAVPIVRARVETFLAGPDSGKHVGNVGLNPELVTPGALAAFRTQVDTALAALRYQAASGPAAMRAQAQSAYAAMQPLLCGLYTLAAGNAGSTSSPCFVTGGATASPVLPDTGSAAGHTIDSLVTSAESQYQSLQAQYAGLGVAMPDLTQGYALPQAPLDTASIRTVFSSPNGIVAGDSLTSMVRTRFGNIEVGGWYQLAEGRRWRSQLAFTLRLPTGTPDSPHNFVDLGTGTKALGWELGMRNDFILREDFWLHAGVRIAGWSSSNVIQRVGPANLLILPIFDTATIRQTLGLTTAIDVVPNWQLDDAFRLGVGVHWTHRSQTQNAYVNAGDAARIGMPASVLNDETQATLLQLGAGLTFSTVNRYARHEASIPYDLTAAFRQTFSGSGGKVPAAAAFYMQIRVYVGH